MGLLLLAITALYAWPRTAVLGAILLTGYQGGAVATRLRMSDPLFSHTLFGVYLGIALWGGLWLRDARVRTFCRSADLEPASHDRVPTGRASQPESELLVWQRLG